MVKMGVRFEYLNVNRSNMGSPLKASLIAEAPNG
jgi:hypothetical protein